MGVIGGSVTVGHGTKPGDKKWPDLVFEWIKERYPHPDHHFTNGAVPSVSLSLTDKTYADYIRATGCDYFSACYEKHVNPLSDLYIVETAINDNYV